MKKKIALAMAFLITFTATHVTLTALGADIAATPDVAYSAEEAKIIKSGYRGQEAAKITVEERQKNSFGGDIVFTLTDSEGNALEGVKFTKISVDTVNTNFGKKDYYNDEDHNAEKGKLAADDRVYFNEDGNAVVLTNVGADAGKNGKLNITFELSPDISFEGDVYAALSSRNDKYLTADKVGNGGIVKVAEVKPVVKIETGSTTIKIGMARIHLGDIVIRELDTENVLGKDKSIDLFIGQYGNGTSANISIIPPKNANVVVTGGMKVKVKNTSDLVAVLTVDKESKDTLSEIKLVDVQVNIDRSVPYGTYELYVSGSALRDNGLDQKTDAAANMRDYFDNKGIVIDNFIVVDPGCGGWPPPPPEVTVFNDGSVGVIVNDIAAEMDAPTVNINGSLYVPLRFIAYAMGSQEQDIVWNSETKTVSVNLNGRVVTWTQDSPIYIQQYTGDRIAMSNNATACIINDRLYIPFRGFAEAFNMPVVWNEETNSATYNPR